MGGTLQDAGDRTGHVQNNSLELCTHSLFYLSNPFLCCHCCFFALVALKKVPGPTPDSVLKVPQLVVLRRPYEMPGTEPQMVRNNRSTLALLLILSPALWTCYLHFSLCL